MAELRRRCEMDRSRRHVIRDEKVISTDKEVGMGRRVEYYCFTLMLRGCFVFILLRVAGCEDEERVVSELSGSSHLAIHLQVCIRISLW